MIALGIDTSNYATSLALVEGESSKIILARKQFLPVKPGEKGLRQQDAVFRHIKNLTDIMSEIKGMDIGVVGVSVRPSDDPDSYMPCFLAGKMSAYSIARRLNIPVAETSHQNGHLAAAIFGAEDDSFYNKDFIFCHVSGGTTDILYINNGEAKEKIGSSLDLFAGQAVDRLGVKLGYPFPAGKYVSELAAGCDEDIKVTPSVKGTYCNLSGLENICDKLLKEGKTPQYTAKSCLTYIGASLLKMIENAPDKYKNLPVIMAGGVMSSDYLKDFISQNIKNVKFVPPLLSSDNRIGVAIKAYRKVKYG